MTVTIGIDPHKGSHTAVALDGREDVLGQLRVRSGPDQLARLAEWANAWPDRTWAVENASGLGYLLSQQLVAAGERVVDVPPKLAARARLLDNGDANKNDPKRRPLGRCGCARSKTPFGGGQRGPRRGDEAVVPSAQGPLKLPHASGQPPPCGDRRARARWLPG